MFKNTTASRTAFGKSHEHENKRYLIYTKIYKIMKSFSQVLIQIVFLFQIMLPHCSKLKLKKVCILIGRTQIFTNNWHLATSLSAW